MRRNIHRIDPAPFLAKPGCQDSPRFLQSQDWPLCCGEPTEFTGSPKNKKELVALTRAGVYWQEKVKKSRVDFEETGPPESYTEVSKFRCLVCE